MDPTRKRFNSQSSISVPNQLYTGHLPALEEQLHQTIKDLKRNEPLAEVWVLVPNQLSRLHLRRELAKREGIAANVRFQTLHELARRLAEPILLEEGWTVLGELALDPLFAQVVFEVAPSLSYLAPIAQTSGFRRALLSTWQELRSYQIAETDLQQITYPDRERAQKAADLGILLSQLSARFAERKWLDSVGMMELALRAATSRSLRIAPLALYSLHEISPLAKQILSACFTAARAHAFLPWCEGQRGYVWTDTVRSWYLREGFVEARLEVPESWPEGLRNLTDSLFDGEPAFIEDHSLALISAPRIASEAAEVARELLFPRMKPGARAAVVVSDSNDEILGALRNRLSAAGFEPYFHACKTLGDSAAGKGLIALCELLSGDQTRAVLLDFLLAAPFLPEHASHSAEWVRIAQEFFVGKDGARWTAQLDKLAATLMRRIERTESDSDDDSACTAYRVRLTHVETFKAFLRTLLDSLERVQHCASWSDAAERLWSYYESIAEIDEDFEELPNQLAQAAALDQAEVHFSIEGLKQLFAVALRTPASRQGKFQRNEPTVATREQLYGVIFDDLLIMGFSEGVFPRRDQPDPLLLDDDRNELNRRLAQTSRETIPLSSDWPDRERYWLQTLVTSARNSLTALHSRSDREERGLIASSFLRELASKLYGTDLTTDELFQRLRDRDGGRYISSHQLGCEDSMEAISESEFDASCLDRNTSSPLLHRIDDSAFKRSFDCEAARFSDTRFTRYDGLLEAQEVLRSLRERHPDTRLYSPTELEQYWQCPFRHFALSELEAYAPGEEAELDPFGPMERGTLIHSILEKYHRARLGKPIAPELYTLDDLIKLADSEMRRYSDENATGPAFLWNRNRLTIRRALVKYHRELMNLGPAWKTIGVEIAFGKQGDENPNVQIADGGDAVFFKGRIDRCDRDESGRLLLTDYKAGRKKTGRARERRLQLCVYSVALAPRSDTIYAQYLFVTPKSCEEDTLSSPRRPSDAEIVTKVRELRRGFFAPDPDKTDPAVCVNCKAKAACGAVRHTRKRRESDADAISGEMDND